MIPLLRPGRRSLLLLAVAALAFAFVAVPAAAKKKPKNPEDLFNPMLGPEYAQWLVGPIVEMASDKEVEKFLELVSDDEAETFIAEFWEQRNADTPVFQKTPQQIFDDRVVEADKRYSEGAYPGSRTDRGKTFILYGEPERIEFENQEKVNDPDLEVWYYAEDTAEGLDGEKPPERVRFVKIDGSVYLYTGQRMRRDPRDELRRRRDGWSG